MEIKLKIVNDVSRTLFELYLSLYNYSNLSFTSACDLPNPYHID